RERAAELIALPRRLDFHHIRAEKREHLRGHRPRQNLREIQNLYTFKRSHYFFPFGTISASTATAPSGRTMNGLTSIVSILSAFSAAKTDSFESASASAAISAGGAPRTPSSIARPAISSIIRWASSTPKGARRNVTSFSTSTKTPPRPNITAGPKTGSQTTPIT